MKITKRQLRRIIKEEKAKIINEMTPGDMGIAAARMDAQQDSPSYWKGKMKPSGATLNATTALGNLHAAIDDLINSLGNEEAYSELQGIVEDWEYNS